MRAITTDKSFTTTDYINTPPQCIPDSIVHPTQNNNSQYTFSTSQDSRLNYSTDFTTSRLDLTLSKIVDAATAQYAALNAPLNYKQNDHHMK